MDAVMEHFQSHWKAYAALVICVAPLLYAFRKQVTPAAWWLSELVAYMVAIHVALMAVMHTAAWFKQNTRMYWEDKIRPDWHMPVFEFWKRAEYRPQWIFYLELVALVAIIFFMVRYRPLRTQRVKPKREHLSKGMAPKVRAKAGGSKIRWKGKR